MRTGSSRFAVTFLLLAAWMAPGLPWLAAHAVFPHDHDHDHEAAEHEAVEAAAVRAILHGHAHPDGVPAHGHEVVTAAPARPEPAPEVRAAVPGLPLDLPSAPRTAAAWVARPSGPPGADPPPLLQLLCVLLI